LLLRGRDLDLELAVYVCSLGAPAAEWKCKCEWESEWKWISASVWSLGTDPKMEPRPSLDPTFSRSSRNAQTVPCPKRRCYLVTRRDDRQADALPLDTIL
jgi:hypothetical protein